MIRVCSYDCRWGSVHYLCFLLWRDMQVWCLLENCADWLWREHLRQRNGMRLRRNTFSATRARVDLLIVMYHPWNCVVEVVFLCYSAVYQMTLLMGVSFILLKLWIYLSSSLSVQYFSLFSDLFKLIISHNHTKNDFIWMHRNVADWYAFFS